MQNRAFFEFVLDFAVIFGIIIFAVERTDTQQYRSGHNEHDWKSCVRQKRTESSNLSCCAKKNTTQQGGVLFCIQRFEQGMSEAKKRPSGAFSTRLHRRGITIDATCPVPSIVPLPRKRLTFSATGSVSPLSVSRCGNTASESLLLRQIKPPSFDGGFIFTQRSQRAGLFSLYSPSISPAARTALRTHCAQGQRTLPVSTPFKSLQIVAPLFS